MLIDEDTRVVVQGITGIQGRFHTLSMLEYGTKIVAGVTPNKAGQRVGGIEVYNSISEAEGDPRASIIFVPRQFAKDAIMEAIDAGMDPIIPITEHIPVRDVMQCISLARRKGQRIIGPNTPGVIACGKCKMGIMPNHIFRPGNIGVVSRSGTLTYEVVSRLSSMGFGQSTVIGLGGDPVTGMDFESALELFIEDPDTDAVVMLGEIGGSNEEKAAKRVSRGYDKPVVAYIAGKTAPRQKTMGHAGAIIEGSTGTYESKKRAFEKAKIPLAGLPGDVPEILESVL